MASSGGRPNPPYTVAEAKTVQRNREHPVADEKRSNTDFLAARLILSNASSLSTAVYLFDK
jgi:hypothetical protein